MGNSIKETISNEKAKLSWLCSKTDVAAVLRHSFQKVYVCDNWIHKSSFEQAYTRNNIKGFGESPSGWHHERQYDELVNSLTT